MSVQYKNFESPELQELLDLNREQAELFQKMKALKPDLWPIVQKKLKIRWTTDSNAIEGSTMTFAETLFVVEEGLTIEGKTLEEQIDARNHAEAIDYLMEIIEDNRPISTGLMKEINALLMRDTKYSQIVAGEYKKNPNRVINPDGSIHKFVNPIQVAQEMEELIDWINDQNGKRDAIIVAALAHYNFVRIHPFGDGNGRGARILMNLILMKSGMIPAVVQKEKQASIFRDPWNGEQG